MLDLARPFLSATCPGDIYKENHCCLRLVKWKSDEDFDVLLERVKGVAKTLVFSLWLAHSSHSSNGTNASH